MDWIFVLFAILALVGLSWCCCGGGGDDRRAGGAAGAAGGGRGGRGGTGGGGGGKAKRGGGSLGKRWQRFEQQKGDMWHAARAAYIARYEKKRAAMGLPVAKSAAAQAAAEAAAATKVDGDEPKKTK